MVNVSVVIPVYNEIRFIQKTLESVIGDADEIILSDNASTDGTSDICQSFTNKYPEVKYTRHKENNGMHKNFYFAINKASGKYIRNLGAHDMISFGSNKIMASLLDKYPDVVMVYPNYIINLNEDYSFRGINEYGGLKDELLADSVSMRIKSMIKNFRYGDIIYGLWRMDLFREIVRPRIFMNICTDFTLMCSTAAKGKMLPDDKSIVFRMFPRSNEPREDSRKRYSRTHFSSTIKNIHYWYFSQVAEVYEILLEIFSENVDLLNETFDLLINKHLSRFKDSDLTLDGMPPIIPGKEIFCSNVVNIINERKRTGWQKKYKKQHRKSNKMPMKKRIKGKLVSIMRRIIKKLE